MTSALVLVGLGIVGAAVAFHLWQRRERQQPTAAGHMAGALREAVLTRQFFDAQVPDQPDLGAAMDWHVGNGLTTLVALQDGTVSLYLNPGGGFIGAGTHDVVAQAAEKFRIATRDARGLMAPQTRFPPPSAGGVIFYLLYREATLASAAFVASELSHDAHPCFRLGLASQELIAAVHSVTGQAPGSAGD